MCIDSYAKYIDFRDYVMPSKIIDFRLEGVGPALTFVSLH